MSIPFRVFRGHVYAVGLKPDGDTIAFLPYDLAGVAALPDSDGNPGKAAFDAGTNGAVDVRFQGVDALETHYQPAVSEARPAGAAMPTVAKPSAGNHHQNLALSRGAAEVMLGMLGITVTAADWHSFGYLRQVTVNGHVVKANFQEGVEVVVVCNAVDRNGRLLGWIFPGSSPLVEGQALSTDALYALLKDCVNTRLIAAGLAYPYFYMSLGAKLRGKLSYYAGVAARYRRGVWASDTSATGVQIGTVADLNGSVVLMPYLYRKILRTWRMAAIERWWAGGDVSGASLVPAQVERFLESGDPYVYIVSRRDFARLSEVIEIQGQVFRMLVKPGDIVFLD